MFITPALAQDPTAPGGSNILLQLMPFILIFAIMYFLIIRPQQKRMRAHREMVASVKRGDMVVTAGGLIGKVHRAGETDDEIDVEIADGVRVTVLRSTLSDVRPKAELRGAAKSQRQAANKAEEIEYDGDAAEEDDAPPSRAAGSANGAAKKPAARKPRATGGTARKTAASTAKTGTAKTGASTRSRRSPRSKSGNGASAGETKDTGDNA